MTTCESLYVIHADGKQGSRLQNRVTAGVFLNDFDSININGSVSSLTASFASTVELYGTRGFKIVMA